MRVCNRNDSLVAVNNTVQIGLFSLLKELEVSKA